MKKRELISQIIDIDVDMVYDEPFTLSKFEDKEGLARYVMTIHNEIFFFDNYTELKMYMSDRFKKSVCDNALDRIEKYTLKSSGTCYGL